MFRAGERFDQYGAKVFFSLSFDRPITPFGFMIVIDGQHFLPQEIRIDCHRPDFRFYELEGRWSFTIPSIPQLRWLLFYLIRTLVKITLCIKHEEILRR